MMDIKRGEKIFIYYGIMLMMLFLTLIVVFKADVFADDVWSKMTYIGSPNDDVTFIKEWDDDDESQRPEKITFTAYVMKSVPGVPPDYSDVPTPITITLTKENNWTYELPSPYYGYMVDKTDKEVIKIEEAKVDGYEYVGAKAEYKLLNYKYYYTITLKNKKQELGNLIVSKTVAGNSGDKKKQFHFTVTLSDKTIKGKFGDMEFKDGVASFTLKHGENKTATNLPANIQYTVKEDDYSKEGYKTSKTGEMGTISKERIATVAFTNTKNSINTPMLHTGDMTNIGKYMFIFAISGMILAILFVWKMGKKHETKK